MFDECVLHIGTEKTGTTSLQQFLVHEREALRERGTVYPDGLGGLTQIDLALVTLDDPAPRRRGDTKEVASRVRGVLTQAAHRAPGARLVLSSEHLHGLAEHASRPEPLIALLREVTERLRVVVYLRPQHDLAWSRYSTVLRAGYSHPFTFPSRPSGFFDYAALLNRWTAALGEGTMTPRLYEPDALEGGDVRRDFLSLLGLPWTGEDLTPPTNTALSGEAQAMLRRINPHVSARGRARLCRLLADHAGERAMPARAEARAFLDLFADSNEQVRREWFPDRETLFRPHLARYPEHERTVDLSEDRAFEMFAHLWEASPRP